MLKSKVLLTFAVLSALLGAPAFAEQKQVTAIAPSVVAVDFAIAVDYPLVKSKFGGFNSGMLPLAAYERDSGLLNELGLPSLRIDLAWGARWSGWKKPPISGTAEDLQYNLAEMDSIAAMLNKHGILPYFSYCYVPRPLQVNRGDYQAMPANPALWGKVLGDVAGHYRTNQPQLTVGYHEIYNEPDNADFFHGTVTNYCELYRKGALGIRAADPDAVVGGPALAFTDSWVPIFLNFVSRERLPLDFFSFHFYPTVPYKSPTVAGVIADMRRELSQHPEFATTEMHLNEYNAYRIDYPEGGSQDHYPLAAALLHDYQFFLTQPDLTQVNWAQIMDTGGGNFSGMISIGGHRKAVFNAAAIYARMPVDRRQLAIQGPPTLEGMASADSHRAAVVVWNQSETNQVLNLVLAGIPFQRGNLRVFRIDAEHSSWGDGTAGEQLSIAESRTNVLTKALRWCGTVPGRGVVYVELEDRAALSKFSQDNGLRLLRVLRFHPNRASRSYADFDRHTWTARLGMAVELQAQEQIGVVAEQWPKRLVVRVETHGNLRRVDANSLLGIRLDYQVGTNYTASVLFHGPCRGTADLYDVRRDAPMPWGTKRQADVVRIVKDLSRFSIDPFEEAPPGWTGRAEVTLIMQNTGPGTRATFCLNAN